jgi:hypothetical protein
MKRRVSEKQLQRLDERSMKAITGGKKVKYILNGRVVYVEV